ncbi:MAG: hypothetical protein LBE91_09855 [Tannerella sp.]|jgi:hypothetical protein|nr:hypothetical protein [Tannerella sp.]
MTVIERIKKIIKYKHISTRKFCIEIGVANGFLDKVKDVGSKKLLKILNKYPEISPEWLLSGKGDMLRNLSTQTIKPVISPLSEQENSHIIDRILQQLQEQSKEIGHLEAEITYLKSENSRLKKENRELNNENSRLVLGDPLLYAEDQEL